jgi:Domain of unknown function (DUF4920)
MITDRPRTNPIVACLSFLLLAFPVSPSWSESATVQTFGKAITLRKVLSLHEAMKQPGKYKDEKVLLEGKIKDVCQMKGCWLMLSQGDEVIRIKFEGYSFFVPKNSRGKRARVEGTLMQETISEEMARHYASEQSKGVDPSQIKGPQQVVTLEASGVQIFK